MGTYFLSLGDATIPPYHQITSLPADISRHFPSMPFYERLCIVTVD